MIQSYFQINDIMVDGIYGESKLEMMMENEDGMGISPNNLASAKNQSKKETKPKGSEHKSEKIKKPFKIGEIWEDYKQVYLDFGLNSDKKVRDKVLFVNSFDSDFNAR
jgi:hypothetical protein